MLGEKREGVHVTEFVKLAITFPKKKILIQNVSLTDGVSKGILSATYVIEKQIYAQLFVMYCDEHILKDYSNSLVYYTKQLQQEKILLNTNILCLEDVFVHSAFSH